MSVGERELRLVGDAEGVPSARRFAAEEAVAHGHARLAGDVQLVVAELVTNALLHATPPVVLKVLPQPAGVRVEVADPVRAEPVPMASSADAMTGRGLALVSAYSTRWGVEPRPDGKIVWCEIDEPSQSGAATSSEFRRASDEEIEALLSGWDDDSVEPRLTVHLGDVPTSLLLAAKAHVDNLVREFLLASTGAAAGSTSQVPTHLAQLIDHVVHRFAQARDAIKRQAVAAFRRGEERTHLTLCLPATAADAGEEYLAALDEADAYARAARLLTLETPPEHKLFRKWYVESLVAQLRAAAAGSPRPPVQTFEDCLVQAYGRMAGALRVSERAARLQFVTAALAAATTTEQVASVVVSEGRMVLQAAAGGLLLPENDHLRVQAAVGYEESVLLGLEAEDPDIPMPALVALKTGEPVWIESRAERDERFPNLRGLEPNTLAMCAVPLVSVGRVLGALRFSFDRQRLFDQDERRFVMSLAAQAALALDRSALYHAERAARAASERDRAEARSLAERLLRLQRITAELVAATTAEAVAEIVTTHAADAMGADVAALSLLESDGQTLRVVRSRGLLRETQERWLTYRVEDAVPTSEAVRTLAPVIVQSRREFSRRFPRAAREVRGDRSVVAVPLAIGGKPIGALSLTFPQPDAVDSSHVSFIVSLSDACAQALDKARAMRATSALAGRLAFLADATTTLSESLDYRETLATIARLVVPRLADWCAVQVVEQGELDTVAVAHVDPGRVAFAEELERAYPPDMQRDVGVAHVIRTGEPEIVPEITDDMLASAAVDKQHLRLIRQLGLRSALVVPLTGPSGTFGAISMYTAESGRRYDLDDLAFAVDMARRAGLAVENARTYREQTGRLAAMRRVAEVAQAAILAPVPARVGPLRLSASYVSAEEEALIGGDLYEVVEREGSVRLLIGDVRGKGLEAVRLATVVLGEFRAAAADCDDITSVVRRMDRRVSRYVGGEDFVTALVLEVGPDGVYQSVSCGHPPAFVASQGEISLLASSPTVPLGLGVAPDPASGRLSVGDRLLLYTDGLIEARDAGGRFADATRAVAPLAAVPLEEALSAILAVLREQVGSALGDDLALLAAEFRPEPFSGRS